MVGSKDGGREMKAVTAGNRNILSESCWYSGQEGHGGRTANPSHS